MKKVMKKNILMKDFRRSPLPNKIRLMENKLRRNRNSAFKKVKFIDKNY